MCFKVLAFTHIISNFFPYNFFKIYFGLRYLNSYELKMIENIMYKEYKS